MPSNLGWMPSSVSPSGRCISHIFLYLVDGDLMTKRVKSATASEQKISIAFTLSTRSVTLLQTEIKWVWYDLFLTVKADYYSPPRIFQVLLSLIIFPGIKADIHDSSTETQDLQYLLFFTLQVYTLCAKNYVENEKDCATMVADSTASNTPTMSCPYTPVMRGRFPRYARCRADTLLACALTAAVS